MFSLNHDPQLLSDVGLARCGAWLLWPLLWIFFNGGRLLCQFGWVNWVNWVNPMILVSQVILSVVELPAYIYAVIIWLPNIANQKYFYC